jgi:hypothetical protein
VSATASSGPRLTDSIASDHSLAIDPAEMEADPDNPGEWAQSDGGNEEQCEDERVNAPKDVEEPAYWCVEK